MNRSAREHCFRYFRAGGMRQVDFRGGEDVAALAGLDRKQWLTLSMPIDGVRFDRRTLELLDTDGDGRIRTAEVVAAVEFLKSRGEDLGSIFSPSEADRAALGEVMGKAADIAALPPSADDAAALAAWEERGRAPEVAVLGDGTAAAESLLKAVEPVIDAFFTPADDLPLVTEDPDPTLPLHERINPRHAEKIAEFAERCVKPLLGERRELARSDWKRLKAAFAPYRDWLGAKPVVNAKAKGELEVEERRLRYRLHLLEFLENFVNMRRLYAAEGGAIFQTGVLRIDARELNLCFHVGNEAAHAALAERSKCCLLYLRLRRPGAQEERLVCAVVTAGTVGSLYVGRNGVFVDRDGRDWEAVVTKVVEAQVSLGEAFWLPWRRLGEGVSKTVQKFLGDRQSAAVASVASGTKDTQAAGAAMASSVAAIGIGIGMVGAALASVLAAVSRMNVLQLFASVAAVVVLVSVPSVILTWFKLRRRDLGAILNASGWAVNRPMRFSMKRAAEFTRRA